MGTSDLPKSTVVGLLFGLLGFAGNWFQVELFFNVDFLFGSIFVVFALLRFGALAGVVAGLLAATSTWYLWNHPWAVVIFGSEAAFLAWRGRRCDRDLLTADFLFWIGIGAPMVWFFYHIWMGIPLPSTLLIVLKQAVNGILNTLLGTLAYLLLCVWRRRDGELPSFRQLVFLTFVALVVLPATTYLVWNLRQRLAHEKEEIVTTVARLGSTGSAHVRQYLEEQVRTVQTMAKVIGDPGQTDPAVLQRQLELFQAAAPGIVGLAVADADAIVVARSPRGGSGDPLFAGDRSARALLGETAARRQPVVTDILRGPRGSEGALVAVVAPIVRGDAVVGYCAAFGDFALLRPSFETISDRRPHHFTLLDRQQRVIVSTRDDVAPLTRLTRPDGTIREEEKGVGQWIPHPEIGVSVIERWRRSYFFKEARLGEDYPWTVVVEGSPAQMLGVLTRATSESLAHMLLLIVATIGVSHLISRGFIRTLRALETASNAIPGRLHAPEPILWPRSGIRELDRLSRNFQQLGAQLADSFAELQAMNESLERRIAERTEALVRSEERFRSLFERHQAIMLVIYPETGAILNANLAAAKFYGYDRTLLRSMYLKQLRVDPTPLPTEAENHYTTVHRLAGGEERVMEVYSTILDLEEQKVIFAILHDVTERQRMEAELRHGKIEWERTFDAVPDLICTLDSRGRIQRINRAMAERLGIDKEAAIGEYCFACTHATAEPHEFCPLIRTLADLRPQSADIAEEDFGGCFHITTTPLFDADGTYIGTVHVARDISEEKKVQDHLHYLSLHDELTGLFNRRALDGEVEREWRRATRLPHPVSLLLLDIDHFKAYNDTWGHLQGDVCLKEIAAAVQRSVFRAEDFAARYGGEEFAVLLPMTAVADAVQIAERIRRAVESREVRHMDGSISRVTISIGVATLVPEKELSPVLLFALADEALYAAKSAGRNRVVVHRDSGRLAV